MSKDHRPDLAQFKVMQSSLGAFALPLATLMVSGEQADDILYLPVIEQSRQVLQRRGLLYIGDSKMEALQIRATLASGGDFYLTPLSKKGKQGQLLDDLLETVWGQQQPLTEIHRHEPDASDPPLLAQAFETTRAQCAEVEGQAVAWEERVLVIYSPTLAEAGKENLAQRIEQAQADLLALTPPPARGRRQFSDLPPLQAAVAAILKRYQVADLLTVTYLRQESQRSIRPYKEQPARTETTVRYQLQVTPDSAAIQHLQRKLGWRLFVTNAPAARLALADAVLAYREAPHHEHNFSRLKNRPLGLHPLFLHRPDHMQGLVRLLSLALRILTLMEFLVRRELHQQQAVLTDLYEGNPHRTTNRPTTERLLRAFQPITLTAVLLPGQQILHLTPLTPLQAHILALLRLPSSIYSALTILPNAISP
jgi:transposase